MLNEIKHHQESILPSIEDVVTEYEDATYYVKEKDIEVDVESLPYSFLFSYFERFGWQAFLVPKSNLIEDDFSHSIYEKLQTIATTYNQSLRIYEKPETAIFALN